MDKLKIALRGLDKRESDSRYRLNMTWRQVFVYVQESEGCRVNGLPWQEGVTLAGSALGYDVTFSYGQEELCVSLIREGIEEHTFRGTSVFDYVYEFLLSELAFNANYYPFEEGSWSPEGLNALCCGEKSFRKLCED